jgi:hypothetical protein
MASLRTFHIFFIMVVIAATEAFGIWAIWDYTQRSKDLLILALGVLALAGGLGLIGYMVWFIRKLERADIH